MFKKLPALVLFVMVLLSVVAQAEPIVLVLPVRNYQHWQKLEKVCETGRQTYGANEFLENGKICRWTLVSYWPENKK